jgi:hypothetical protein
VFYEEATEELQGDNKRPQLNKPLKLVTVDRSDIDSLVKGDKFIFADFTLEVERVVGKDDFSVTAVCSEFVEPE